jgi:hypothetical protein
VGTFETASACIAAVALALLLNSAVALALLLNSAVALALLLNSAVASGFLCTLTFSILFDLQDHGRGQAVG